MSSCRAGPAALHALKKHDPNMWGIFTPLLKGPIFRECVALKCWAKRVRDLEAFGPKAFQTFSGKNQIYF